MAKEAYNEVKDLKNKEEFDRVLGETSLKNYLKVSAYASGERSKLEKSLNGDMFYKSLYAHSKDAERYIEDLKSRIKYDDVRNIVLSGYKGCGKTTFIHYFVRRLCMRHLFLNFDRVVNYGQEIRSVIVSYIYKNIWQDCLNKECAIIEKFLAIYDENENNFDFLENEIDIENKFKNFFYALNSTQMQRKNQTIRDERKRYLNNCIKICLNEFEISQLLLLIVMWDIAEREQYGLSSECMIVFDNIDMIYNTTRLPEFTEQVALFRNNADRLFEHIAYNGQSLGDPSQIYICVFVMRETTKAEFMEHFHDQRVSLYVPIKGMSNLYSVCDIVKCRGKYLEILKEEKGYLDEHCIDLYNKITLINMVIEDRRVCEDLLGLFNHDFRTCFEVLSEMNFSDGDFFRECRNLKNINDKGFSGKPAFRCLVYRAVFDLLQANGLFSKMRSSDFQITVESKTYAANLDRFMLLFLSNSQSLYASEEDREKEFISLKEVFQYFLRFFDTSSIINSIWDMYEMRKSHFWNHLVTFDEMNDVTKDELRKQIDSFVNHEDCKYGKIRITVGGRKYVETLLPHFEYFAARVFGKDRPSLFRFSAEELANTSSVTSYISAVRQEEEICCEKLKAFYTNKFKDVEDFSGDNFLMSKFAWKKLTQQHGIIKMFHCERIIHAQVGYLDAFRKYVFYKMNCVLDVGGFLKDIDITDAVLKQIRCNNGGCFAGQSFIGYDGVYQYIARKKENSPSNLKIQVLCRKHDGTCIYEVVPLDSVVYAIKVLLNYKLVREIQVYINQFDVDGKKSDVHMYSYTTKYLVGCYSNCIEEIKNSCYSDFKTNIDRKTGVIIGDRIALTRWNWADGASEERHVWDKFEYIEEDMSDIDPIEDNLSL